MNKFPMTLQGAELLREEVHQLKSVARPTVITAIAEARAHGDLKENAEYHAAKEQQGFIEGRIAEIDSRLANSQIIDVSKLPHDNKVVFGVTVRLINIKTDEEVAYQIVGDDEADIKLSKISVSSPIARALIGKMAGDEVTVVAPGGEIDYEIDAVLYAN